MVGVDISVTAKCADIKKMQKLDEEYFSCW